MGFAMGFRKRARTTAAPSIPRSPKKGSSSGGNAKRVNTRDLKRADKNAPGTHGRRTSRTASDDETEKSSPATTSSIKSARIRPTSRASDKGIGSSNVFISEEDRFGRKPRTSSYAKAAGKNRNSTDGHSTRKTLRNKHPQQSSLSKNLTDRHELHRKSFKMLKQSKLSKEEVVTSDQPKRKKRVIQIDPYDISNKRIDDSVPAPQTEDKDMEKSVDKFSKNMQLRSIKPSPSALSFVEDNLLGRRRTIELKRAGYNIDLSAPLDNIPFSTSKERSQIEENVFRNKMEFFAAAKVSSSFPPSVLPEIAFAGISNVGKSSLLNGLTRQWGVARTSDKPGHTQTINFFRLASKLCLVDLPGYGFAYAKTEVKEAWEDLVMEYVSTREGLQRVCLLIDTKRGMKSFDHELIDLMDRSRTPFQVVLTKTDLVFPIDVARRATQIQQDLETRRSMVQPVMMVSSKTGGGIRSFRTVLSKLARFARV